jgi:hypothetical protein
VCTYGSGFVHGDAHIFRGIAHVVHVARWCFECITECFMHARERLYIRSKTKKQSSRVASSILQVVVVSALMRINKNACLYIHLL